MRLPPESGSIAAPASRLRSFLVIFNPTAGHRRQLYLKQVLNRLTALGCRIEMRETTCRGDAEQFCRNLQPGDYDGVLIAGGDGTINEAINGLQHTDIPVGIIPTGTANVMACELNMPQKPEAVANMLASATPRMVHAGSLNGRKFIMMAGAGFDAHVVAAVTPALKRSLRKMAYVLKSLTLLFRFNYPPYQITIDGRDHSAASVVIANGHYYGGKYVCAPEAKLADPDLHVCLFRKQGRLAAATYALWLLIGRLHKRHDIDILRGRDIRLSGPDGDPVQADGDIAGHLPVHIIAAAGSFLALAE